MRDCAILYKIMNIPEELVATIFKAEESNSSTLKV
jgi:hypothetical protein